MGQTVDTIFDFHFYPFYPNEEDSFPLRILCYELYFLSWLGQLAA